MQRIINNIRNKSAHLTLLGCGYVGLPTVALFANAGFQVTAVDIKPEIVAAVNGKVSPINEPGLNHLISDNVATGRLRATLNLNEVASQTSIYLITIQTPIDENKKPDLTFLTKGIEAVGKVLKKGTLVVIGSTIPPGTMFGKVTPILESLSGLTADEDFFLCYVPERIAPGKSISEFVESPRLIGGIGEKSTRVTTELFQTVCKKVLVTNAITAELAKVAENTYRDINIAFANQLALICEQHGADVAKVIELANTHPRVNIHLPGPGVGGPCLTKDPYLLINDSASEGPDIIRAAREVNDYMPHHVVALVLSALADTGKKIQKSKLTVLGIAYKADVDDSRISPAEPIIKELMNLGAEVTVFDPYCKETFGAQKANSINESVTGADCVVTVTDHTLFKKLNLSELKGLMDVKPAIVDGKRVISPDEARKLDFIYYSVGYSNHCPTILNEITQILSTK